MLINQKMSELINKELINHKIKKPNNRITKKSLNQVID